MQRTIPVRKPRERHTPYGDHPSRAEHRALRVGHVSRPPYPRKLARLITRVLR